MPYSIQKRKVQLSSLLSLLIVVFGLLISSNAIGQVKPTPPNIIVFMVDDMGWQDTSVPFWTQATNFNKRYRTPNMERMAREGMKFTNAYAMPVCTPTRVSLLTGVNAAHHRVTQWTSPDKNKNTDYADSTVNSVDWNINGFSPVAGVEHTFHATPLPAVLKQNGYYTIHSGKAHFGSAGTPGSNPLNSGFDINIAGCEIGSPASYLGKNNYDKSVNGKKARTAVPGLEAYHGTDVFLTDAITTEALKALEKPVAEKKPFLLYLAHYAIHIPIDIDNRFFGHYRAAGLDSTEARYAALIEGMDKSLGDLMNYLDTKKLTNNTVILFMSDNGGLSNKARSGPAWELNRPLRAGKGSVYEGGIREPMLVRWPGTVKPASVAEQYVIIEDFFPTILEIAGIKKPELIQRTDGWSFVPLLKNPTLKNNTRELVWHHPNKWIPEEGPAIHYSSAFRKGDWKLVYDQRHEKLELYNLKEDIGERNDLATKYPKKLKELAELLTKKLKAWDAQRPTFKKTGELVPWPNELAAR